MTVQHPTQDVESLQRTVVQLKEEVERLTGTNGRPAKPITANQHGQLKGGNLHSQATASYAGFMAASDKGKLDGIEEGAQVNPTAEEALESMKTVDGTGSGLDADLLRGTAPSAFALTLLDDAAAADARTTLELGSMALQDTPLAVTEGGTGGTDAATARTNLGLGTIATKGVLAATATLDFPSVVAQSSADLTISLPGAVVNDPVMLGPPASVAAGVSYFAFISAADVATVRCVNSTAGAVDPPPAGFTVVALKL